MVYLLQLHLLVESMGMNGLKRHTIKPGTWEHGTAEHWRNIWNTTKQRNNGTTKQYREIPPSRNDDILSGFFLYIVFFPIIVQLYTRNPTINLHFLWFRCAGVFCWCYVSVWIVFQGVSLFLRGVPLFRRCSVLCGFLVFCRSAVLPVFCIQQLIGVKLFQWYSMFRCSLFHCSWFFKLFLYIAI